MTCDAGMRSAAAHLRDEMQGAMSDKSFALRAKSDAAVRAQVDSPLGCGGTSSPALLLVGHRVHPLCSLLAPSHRTRGARNGAAYPGVAGH